MMILGRLCNDNLIWNLDDWKLKIFTFSLVFYKLRLTRQNLGQVFNSRCGCMHAYVMHLVCSIPIRTNLWRWTPLTLTTFRSLKLVRIWMQIRFDESSLWTQIGLWSTWLNVDPINMLKLVCKKLLLGSSKDPTSLESKSDLIGPTNKTLLMPKVAAKVQLLYNMLGFCKHWAKHRQIHIKNSKFGHTVFSYLSATFSLTSWFMDGLTIRLSSFSLILMKPRWSFPPKWSASRPSLTWMLR